MKPEAQRIAIAEARGWKPNGAGYWHKDGDVRGLYFEDLEEFGHTDPLPDYLNDLNAMHEAEKLLSPKEFECYRWTLWGQCKQPLVTERHRAYLHATAAQRAEAFLKTLNLWTDEP
jgi:hypothetical protein